MPKDPSIKKVLVIGSGPIIIGQAAEFDYSGTQACRALKSEGIEVVLINSNPATIMTDTNIADRVYVEPMTVEILERIIEKEKPDSILPNLGGQTGLNLAMELHRSGFLEKQGVRLLGCRPDTIERKLTSADAAVVGTYFKEGGKLENDRLENVRVDVNRVREFMEVVYKFRETL